MNLDEERVVYFYELGRALAQWSQLEATLFHFMRTFFRQDEQKLVGMGYVAIEGFRVKLKFADNVVNRAMPRSSHLEDWTALVDQMGEQSKMRNNLAHWQTVVYPDYIEGRRFALIPWAGRKGQPKDQPPEGALCVREIQQATYNFVALTYKFSNFGMRVAGEPEPFPKSAEQPKSPMTIRDLTRRIHAELGHPLQSSREKRQEEDARNAAASLENHPNPEEK